jgi:hypothetical protein
LIEKGYDVVCYMADVGQEGKSKIMELKFEAPYSFGGLKRSLFGTLTCAAMNRGLRGC